MDESVTRSKLLWRALGVGVETGVFDGVFNEIMDGNQIVGHPYIDRPDEFFLRRLHNDVHELGSYISGMGGDHAKPPQFWFNDKDLKFDCLEVIFEALPTAAEVEEAGAKEHLLENPRETFRELLNPDLGFGSDPHEMLTNGEIVPRLLADQHELVESPTPETVPDEVAARFEHAKAEFLRRGATLEAKRAALTELAGLIEHYKKTIDSNWVSKDENALREIANNFGFRHSNDNQKTDFDKAIYYDWVFQVFAASVLASMRVEDRRADS